MSEDNMHLWNKVKTPPPDALKEIKGGRLKGMTDISPQWRYQAMTEQFGPCGIGWKYEPTGVRFEAGNDGQIVVFADINLSILHDGVWSEPIPGNGGSMFIAKETAGWHTSDEAIKMATTDALSVAMKVLGVGADIYMGKKEDRSKHDNAEVVKCPNCGKGGYVDKNKANSFYCWKKKDGCGHTWTKANIPNEGQEKLFTEYENKLDSAFKETGVQGMVPIWEDIVANINKITGSQFRQLEQLKNALKKQAEKA